MFSNVDVTEMFLRHPDSRIFHIHIQPGGPHTRLPPSINSQKTAKSAIPHLAGHTLQPMPHRSPCASDLHTDHIPYCHSLTRCSPRLARFLAGLQSIHGGSSRQLTSYPPRPARPVHSNAHPANSLKFPAPARGAWVRRQRRRCVGVDDRGPGLRRRQAAGRRGTWPQSGFPLCGILARIRPVANQ